MARVESLVHKVRVKTKHLLDETGFGENKSLVVGVSGGPDSMTLLDCLISFSSDRNLSLHAAHLNHGIRPESVQVADQMQQIFSKLGVPFTIGRVDVPSFRQTFKLSEEESARYLRYKFLTEVAEATKSDAIAVAHTADDQAETVLMHLIRGSGIYGLSGMRPIHTGRIYPDLPLTTLIRPTLAISKLQTNKYCNLRKIDPEFDRTNQSSDYTRNRIRLSLLPELATYNPRIKSALGQLAQISAEVSDLLDTLIDQVWEKVVIENSDGSYIDRKSFGKLHPGLKQGLVRRFLFEQIGSLQDLGFAHFQQVLNLMSGPSEKFTQLPGGAIFKVNKHGGAITNL